MNDPGDESNNASGHPGLGSNLPEYQQRIGLEVRRIFHGLANYAATIPGGNRTIDFTNPEVVRAVMQMADFSQTRNAGNGGNLSALQQQIGSELRRIYNGAGPSHASPRTGASASDLTRPELVQAVLQMAANQAPASHQHAHSHSHTQPHMASGHHSHHGLPHHSHSHQPRVMNSGGFGVPPGGQTNIRMEAEPDENQNDGGGGALTVDGQPDWRQILKWCQLSGPFVLLISIKLLYDHRLGLLLFACLMGTFYYTNRKLELEIYNSFMRDNRQGRSKLTILGIILLLLVNTAAIYFVFSDQELYKSLYFQLPLVDSVDLWNLAWILVVTDFVLKFGAIVIKGLVSLLPRALLSHNKRGKYYMFLEQLSQLYRGLVPIRPWLHYLSDTQHGGQVVSTILLIIYTLCKANLVYKKLLEVKEAFKKVRTDMVFGQKPSREDLKESGDSCPICQDDYREPVQLSCRHIFCEDCVSIWFDREKTCPMCRAQIADNPLWRDGSTSSHVQWY